MSKSCPDCGSRISGSYCSWCNEERCIFENQIYRDDYDQELSQEFADKVNEQKGSKR